MPDAASPTPDQVLARFAKIFRMMRERGMTDRAWDRLQNEPELIEQVVQLLDPIELKTVDDIQLPDANDIRLRIFLHAVFGQIFPSPTLSFFYEGEYPDKSDLEVWCTGLDKRALDTVVRMYFSPNYRRRDMDKSIAESQRTTVQSVRSSLERGLVFLRQRNWRLIGEKNFGKTMPELLKIPLTELDFSERARNCLSRARIYTVGQLLDMTEADLLRITNFGQKSVDETKEKLSTLGLTLKPS